ncbi:putative Vacuolar import and degradation protein 27 [Glarea lozoyensis 74030]|uniref:Putative Vacuolar import and degradation protein 27 n=1 Tax=Glarea lozoyensis (strain ATCC 74030 / MF5533) TaxID=1104152 RepID=H0EH73_GLAL7|nr:putative Vacuolar import and degradation protein 27 [Glarea lozoyensis 74030]
MIEIAQGQLYLVRPRSMKGYSELIFKDGAARIRKTNQEFQYQLVIQRAYEEGEEELLDEEDAESATLAGERDEKTFLLDEELHFRSEIREGGEKVLAWRDLSGDAGDLYEFVCDTSVEEAQVQAFELTTVRCQYERKHHSALKRDVSPLRSRKQRSPSPIDEGPTAAPPVAAHPEPRSILGEESGELHLFDFQSGSFIIQDAAVSATVSEVDEATLTRFQEALMQALWEQLNEIKWNKTKDDDRDYVLEAFQDLAMDDAEDPAEEEEYEEEELEDDAQRKEEYDTDEEDDDIGGVPDDGNVNSQLAVGYKHDRSFVVRGSKIGVFKHTPNNNLEFSTNISKVETPGGKLFNPKKVMLHAEDTNMILQNEGDPNSLYRMDLEYGKIVDEWKVHDDIPVNTFAPESKFAQMTGEQTFLGLSRNALYRIDPRLAGNKLVDSELKQYVSKNDFSAAATTDKGYIAVASNKGDIRMFDRLGINAKTHIPALGEPIIGLDVSADGRWVLATCRTYLLLIDALQKTGKNEGKLGFEKSFGKDSKPQPRRLGLTPSHVAQFQHETGAPLSFTTARFNTGEGISETSIITATGPFIVTWNMKKVLRGSKDPYSIKRYAEEVKADNFKYGSDKNVIVALPNEVNMVAKQSFKKPTRESIMNPAQIRLGGRRSDAGRLGTRESSNYKLGKDDIVESPY